ncbi:MAG TPA: hypothetical protein PL182_10545, partial [Pseudobdellovibrionaceae bacterium]|nr:hypothetical protein [Pseudobdellovibrionaceae bacterium]
QYFVNSHTKVISEKTLQQIRSEKGERERQIEELRRRIAEMEGAQLEILVLKAETKTLRRWNLTWSTLSFLLGGLVLFRFFWS